MNSFVAKQRHSMFEFAYEAYIQDLMTRHWFLLYGVHITSLTVSHNRRRISLTLSYISEAFCWRICPHVSFARPGCESSGPTYL